MKNPPPKKIFSFFIILFLFSSCAKENKMDLETNNNKISNIEVLSSPSREYDVYIYNIESGMSFGSPINAIKIVKHNEKPKFYTDFLTLQNSRPFKIVWNNNILIINTIAINHSNSTVQPVKSEMLKHKGVEIKNNVFTMFSSMATSDFRFSDFYEKNGTFIFKNDTDSLVFSETNSQISIGPNYAEINCFKQNEFDKTKGLAFDAYKLIPQQKFDFKKLDKFQPLKIIEK